MKNDARLRAQSSISSSLMIPRRLAMLFTFDMTSSCTKLKLIAKINN